MKPETIGRVFGTGLRVAGRMAGQRINAAAQSSQTAANAANPASHPPSAYTAPAPPRTAPSGTLGKGLAGFFRPFRRVGGKVWLEVTGVFFFLPVLVFSPTLWRTRFSYAHGPDHRTFLASAVVVVIFFYLGVTSFWRARKR